MMGAPERPGQSVKRLAITGTEARRAAAARVAATGATAARAGEETPPRA